MEQLQYYREQAQKAARRAGPKLFKVFTVFALICAVLNFLSYLLQTPAYRWQSTCQQYISAGNFDIPAPPLNAVYGTLFALVLGLLVQMFYAGWISVSLHAARGDSYSWHDLSSAFPNFWKVLVITVVRGVCCGLASCLLVIPGIMLFYNWRLSYYVLAEHPEYGPIRCLKQSRLLMKGERMNLLRLDVSCWLLYGLAALIWYVTSGILPLWHMPSVMVLYAVFYNKMVYWKEPEDDGAASNGTET